MVQSCLTGQGISWLAELSIIIAKKQRATPARFDKLLQPSLFYASFYFWNFFFFSFFSPKAVPEVLENTSLVCLESLEFLESNLEMLVLFNSNLVFLV